MNNNLYNYLENKIKFKFLLYTDLRKKEIDYKIFNKIIDICINDLFNFLEENLNEKEWSDLEKKLLKTNNDSSKIDILNKIVVKIPNYNKKIKQRIDEKLEEIYIKSLNNKKNNE